MFSYSRPFNPHANNALTAPKTKQFQPKDFLLKLAQTIFVGIGVVGFVLLFQGK